MMHHATTKRLYQRAACTGANRDDGATPAARAIGVDEISARKGHDYVRQGKLHLARQRKDALRRGDVGVHGRSVALHRADSERRASAASRARGARGGIERQRSSACRAWRTHTSAQ